MFKHDSNHWASSQDGTLYTRSMPDCLVKDLHMWGSASSFILISNERCISHKLFAQCVLRLLQFDSVLWLDSFADGGLSEGAPSAPTPHILNTCSGAEDGYSRHVKQWQGQWDHLDCVSGMTVEEHRLKIQPEHLLLGWYPPRLYLIVFVPHCDFSRFVFLPPIFFFFFYGNIKKSTSHFFLFQKYTHWLLLHQLHHPWFHIIDYWYD